MYFMYVKLDSSAANRMVVILQNEDYPGIWISDSQFWLVRG